MSQRNASGSGSSHSRCHSRNDLERNMIRAQHFNLFAGSAEDQWISALEPHHPQSRSSQGDHQTIDVALQDFLFSATLADVVNLRRRRNQFQYFWRDQVVMQNRFRRLQEPKSFQCQQFGITRPRTHEIDFSAHALCPSARSTPLGSVANGGVLPRAASNASRLASECSNSDFVFLSSSLAKIRRLVSPSCCTQSVYPWPNWCSSCCRSFCASDGLCPAVEIAICRSPRWTTAG